VSALVFIELTPLSPSGEGNNFPLLVGKGQGEVISLSRRERDRGATTPCPPIKGRGNLDFISRFSNPSKLSFLEIN
jgi:hypothetical protein